MQRTEDGLLYFTCIIMVDQLLTGRLFSSQVGLMQSKPDGHIFRVATFSGEARIKEIKGFSHVMWQISGTKHKVREKLWESYGILETGKRER